MNIKAIFVAMSVFCGVFAMGTMENVAHAGRKKKITIKNETGSKLRIRVFFRALGCAGSTGLFGTGFICKKKSPSYISNNGSKTWRYKFPGGTSAPGGVLFCHTGGGWKTLKTRFKVSKTITLKKLNGCKAY